MIESLETLGIDLGSVLDIVELLAIAAFKFVWDQLKNLRETNANLEKEIAKLELTFNKNFMQKQDIQREIQQVEERLRK